MCASNNLHSRTGTTKYNHIRCHRMGLLNATGPERARRRPPSGFLSLHRLGAVFIYIVSPAQPCQRPVIRGWNVFTLRHFSDTDYSNADKHCSKKRRGGYSGGKYPPHQHPHCANVISNNVGCFFRKHTATHMCWFIVILIHLCTKQLRTLLIHMRRAIDICVGN